MVVPKMSNHPKRDYVLQLMKEKDQLEIQIRELTQILTNNNVGMNDPLVDREGYPISSIDVYQVRHARHRIICLQNDHKAIMKQIEQGLHEIYGSENAGSTSSATENCASSVDSMSIDDDVMELPTVPFAKVNMIRDGSPADIDGIRLNDQIVQFGSVNSDNFKSLNDLATVAQHSQGTPLKVKVLRNKRIMELSLTPRTWVGRGLLGCNIVMLDAVDR